MKKNLITIFFLFIFTNTWSQSTIPDFDFENWSIATWSWGQLIYNPDDWITVNFDPGSTPINGYLVTVDSDSYHGQLAAQFQCNGAFRAWAYTQFAATQHPQNLTAYVKCDIYSPDTVTIRADILSGGSIVDSGVWSDTSSISSYQLITIPISQNSSVFDSIRIYIEGGIHLSLFPQVAFTTLKVDYLQFDQFATVSENNLINQQVIINPNPINSFTTITTQQFTDANLSVYDITGRALLQQPFNTKATIDLSQLTNGVYIVEVKDKKGKRAMGKVVKE